MSKSITREDIDNTKPAYYIGISNYSFRSGEAAKIIGVISFTPENQEERVCYHARYADGFEDFCPINDVSNYEIVSHEKIDLKFSRK